MRDFAPRFAPAAVSARGDFRTFLKSVYKKDYSACSADGFFVILCNGEAVNNPALNAMDKKTLEHGGICSSSNAASEYVCKMFEAEAQARAC